jgi:hypothetical protein
MNHLYDRLILLFTLLLVASCSSFKSPNRYPASLSNTKLTGTTYQNTILFSDNESLTQKFFPNYAKIHYDLFTDKGIYLGKIEFKRDKKLSLSVLSPRQVAYLDNQVNQWTGRTFGLDELDYLQRTKFYTALQLGDNHQVTLRALKDRTIEMTIKVNGKQHKYRLNHAKAYPLD